MKLEDVKKIKHDEIKHSMDMDNGVISLIRVKDDKEVVKIHFFDGPQKGLVEFRCVLNGHANLDDLAAVIAVVFSNFAANSNVLAGAIRNALQ